MFSLSVKCLYFIVVLNLTLFVIIFRRTVASERIGVRRRRAVCAAEPDGRWSECNKMFLFYTLNLAARQVLICL